MPNAPNYELAEIDYINGMKYKEIAEKYGVSINTIKSWKTRYGWSKIPDNSNAKKCAYKNEKVCTQNEKSVHTKNNNKIDDKEAVVNEVELAEENADLTEKQRLFCLYFTKSFNATRAYLKAYNCSYSTAAVEGSKLLRNPKIKNMINILKKERITREYLTQDDIFQKYIDIAFADLGDYVKFGIKRVPAWKQTEGQFVPVIDPNTGMQKINEYSYVDLKESDCADTSLLAEISEGQSGIKVKMHDQMKALDWLAKHMDMATEEQKAKIELLNAQRDKLQHKEDTGDDESVVIINDV
jgi:phage terminase small subunit